MNFYAISTSNRLENVLQFDLCIQLKQPFGNYTSSSFNSPSLLFLIVSRISRAPSTLPIADLPLFQSTTIGHLRDFGFFSASSTIPLNVGGSVPDVVGCAESKTIDGLVAGYGR